MMETVFYIIAKVISLMLNAISLAMFTRIMMELIGRMTSYDVGENRFFIFCYTVTEIFVTPFRFICYKLNLFQGTPIDMPFMIAYISVALLQSFMPLI